MKKILFSFIGLLLFSACELSVFQPTLPTSTSTPLVASTLDRSCVSIEPKQDDIDRALSFTGKLFDTPNWERSYSVMEGRVAVTWLHVDGFLAYLEAIIFPCGYQELDIDNYFSDENWEIILSNYESYTMETECRGDTSLRLYELFVIADNIEYEMRYWVANDTYTRVITLMLVFPLGFENMMNDYANNIFPTLVTCG
ncbi:MAG TPA: hypothetical protein DIW23_05865 [Anaerolineae bacterium]|nr:hypothetical protein [Anaerolineae bacterium]